MNRIVFLSGKGGTGKTTLAAAYAASSAGAPATIVDADVDAANLHLVLAPEIRQRGDFRGSQTAVRDDLKCVSCGRCRAVCRFDAIGADLQVADLLCEGCGACVSVCPSGALRLADRVSGTWYLGETAFGPMIGAELVPGEEASGKLIAHIKERADAVSDGRPLDRMILDGSPGIGCPVIASAAGATLAVLVTEPSVAGLHDLQRILGVVRHFGIPSVLVINKSDLSEDMRAQIEAFAHGTDLPILARVPYDPAIARAFSSEGGPAVLPDGPGGQALADAVAELAATVGEL